jgi:hypothetical protein
MKVSPIITKIILYFSGLNKAFQSESFFLTFIRFYLILFFFSINISCKKQVVAQNTPSGQAIKNCIEILGRPTGSSVTVSILFDQMTEVYCEYGTISGTYKNTTTGLTAVKDVPVQVELTGLNANSEYFYRTRYKQGVNSDFLAGLEHSFHTQRAPGSTYSFTVESDPHPYDKKGCHNLWHIALQNQLNDNADFMLDLGDTFGDDHNPFTIKSEEVKQLHLDLLEFFGTVCHSMPMFFCLGNHEGEKGYYLLQTPPNNLATYESIWRKFYYPNPEPNAFYSGNTEVEGNNIGKPQNYYSWVWGDALFVVLDVYRYATANEKPQGWDFTLGKEQYDWLKKTLENSSSKFKFVFAHHIRGEGRGGLTNAKYYEWGGYEADGVTYGFTSRRAGWSKPIHKLFVDTGVKIFFQGHDHVFSHEILDGVTYQEVPMPSDSTYQIGMIANGDSYTSDVLDGAGHIRITVTPSGITADYVQACLPADENANRKNRKVAFSYTLK